MKKTIRGIHKNKKRSSSKFIILTGWRYITFNKKGKYKIDDKKRTY